MAHILLKSRLKINIILFAMVVFGFSLRVHNIAKHDFWFDEVITHEHITMAYPAQERYFVNNFLEKNPPFYFILLRQWAKMFGDSELPLRMFSCLFGSLSILLTYKVGRLFFNRSTSLVAAGFLTLSPFQIWYSQEARAFSLSLFLSLVNAYFFFRGIKSGANNHWLGYFLSLICLFFTTYFGLFLLIPQAALILSNRKFILKWLLSFLGAAILFSLFIYPSFTHQFAAWRFKSWLSAPAVSGLIPFSLSNFLLGYNSGPFIYNASAILIPAAVLFAFLKTPLKPGLSLFFFLFLPVLSVFAFSQLFFPVYLDRSLIIFSPFLYILLSRGVCCLKKGWFRGLVIVVFVASLGFSLANYYRDLLPERPSNLVIFLKKPVRPLVDLFLRNKEKGDVTGFSNYGFMNIFQHYLREASAEYAAIPKFYFFISPGDEFFENEMKNMRDSGFKSQFNFIDLDKDALSSLAGRRIWLFSASWKRQGGLEPYARKVKLWFDGHCRKINEWYKEGAWAAVYRLK